MLLGCARFAEVLQNFIEPQILWSFRSVVFHALTLKLPLQTSLSVAPKLPVYLRSGEKSEKFDLNFPKAPDFVKFVLGSFSCLNIEIAYCLNSKFL